MAPPASECEMVDAIADAVRRAVSELFENRPNETFYYCSLTTTGEGHAPTLTAWSREALADAVHAAGDGPNVGVDVKWSYADSPYFNFGAHHFETVRAAFDGRDEIHPRTEALQDRLNEVELRLGAMEKAVARLDAEGLFGTGERRLRMVLNVEVMPPDHTNVSRALRLNPREALADWLAEAAEP